MEYIIFRLLRLIGREIEMYEDLYSCLSTQHDKILRGDVLDLLENITDQDDMLNVISDIERDIKEEIFELSNLLKIKTDEPNINDIVEALSNKYPKICGFFIDRSIKIDDLLAKIGQTNSQNLSLLKNSDTIWKDIMPLLNAWKEFEPWWENKTDKIDIEKPIYEFNYN